MKVLVTGATGFVGGEVASRLISNGVEVIGISKNSSSLAAKNHLKYVQCDITDRSELFAKFTGEKFDAIIHCAGLAHQFGDTEKSAFQSVNEEGTRNVAELAVRCRAKKFILISSTAVYGYHRRPMAEDTICRPETDYAASKLNAEIICQKLCVENKLPLTVLRLAPVLGEKGIGNVPKLIRAIHSNKFIMVGNGMNKKSLVYVGDVADACLKILETENQRSDIYNISAEPVSMKDLVKLIALNLNKKTVNFSVPVAVPKLFFEFNRKITKLNKINKISQTFDKWLAEDVYPADKFRRDYQFVFKTPIKTAIGLQCRWFIEKEENSSK